MKPTYGVKQGHYISIIIFPNLTLEPIIRIAKEANTYKIYENTTTK